ncbi:MAG TPA: hypothetical protein VL485_01360 [Ktedonobacteraceae bacterium]|nr:hypothetical protein [Ktedonobacteraceae bacterium]
MRSERPTGWPLFDYLYTVSRISSTPLPGVWWAVEQIARSTARVYYSAQQARPIGAVND